MVIKMKKRCAVYNSVLNVVKFYHSPVYIYFFGHVTANILQLVQQVL